MKRRIPIVICLYNDIISGVTAWAFRLKKAFENNPDYEVLLLNWVGHDGIKQKYDFNVSDLADVNQVLERLAPAIVVPNYIWQIYAGISIPKMHLVGFCHSDTKEEYYDPLSTNSAHISKFIAVSPTCQTNLEKILPHRINDITMLPYGVPVPNQLERTYQTEPVRLMYGGRIIQEQKRVFDFIPLVQNLIKSNVDFLFDIVGEGPDFDELHMRMNQEAPTDRVRFLGRQEPAQMAHIWRNHDIFIQTSSFEGTSVSMLEAMAQGTIPVVTAASSGVSSVISHGKNGLINPIGDMAALAYSISYLARNRQRLTEMGNAAHENAKRYSMDAYVKTFTALLDEMSSLSTQKHITASTSPPLAAPTILKTTPDHLAKPTISYMICTTPRSGSNWLCNMLTDTKMAGYPCEYFLSDNLKTHIDTVFDQETAKYLNRINYNPFSDDLAELLRDAQTKNGVFGIKTMMNQFNDFVKRTKQKNPQWSINSRKKIVEKFLPNAKWIWLTRRNKVQQAISYSKAIQTNVWYTHDINHSQMKGETIYDFELINRLLRVVARQETMWQEFFAEAGLAPLVLVYEDIVQQPEKNLQQIFHYLGLPTLQNFPTGKRSRSKRLSNKTSEDWYGQFMRECDKADTEWWANIEERRISTTKVDNKQSV